MEDPAATHDPVLTTLAERLVAAAEAAITERRHELLGETVVVRGRSLGERLERLEGRSSDLTPRQGTLWALSGAVIDPVTGDPLPDDVLEYLVDTAPESEIRSLIEVSNELAGLGEDSVGFTDGDS